MKTIVNGLTLEQIATLEDQHELTRAAYANGFAAGLAVGWAEQLERDCAAACLYCGNPHWTPAEYDADRGHFYHTTHATGRLYGPDLCHADVIRRDERERAAALPPAASGEETRG